MWSFFTRKLKHKEPKKPKYNPKARVYTMGGGWGNAINLTGDWTPPGIRVVGWKRPRPNEGETLTISMQSGKTAVGVFTKMDYCSDPADMFFADVFIVGHKGEPGL